MTELISLLRSSITGEKCILSETFSLEDYREVIRKQSLVPLIYPGAVNCGIPANQPIMQTYFAAYCRHMLRSEAQMAALEGIFSAFQRNHIDFLPMKGCILKQHYPKPEMRLMTDADILIREEQLPEIRAVMEEQGFVLESDNHHTQNYRCSALYVELHKCPVPPDETDYYAYYGTGWQLAVQQQGSRYAMRQEDEFLFLLTHLARHYRRSGIGCRQVVDLYVFRKAHPQMDETYLYGELKKLRLTAFYENVLRLLKVWFEGGTPDPVTRHIGEFILSGGMWGSGENGELSRSVKAAKKQGDTTHSKGRSYLEAFFPPKSWLQYRYPILNRHPWLLPAVWLIRGLDLLLFRHKRIRKRLAQLQLVDRKSTERYRDELELVGLDFYFE